MQSKVDFFALFKGLYLVGSEILLTHTHTHTHTHTGAGRNLTLSNLLLRARKKRAVKSADKGFLVSSLWALCRTLLSPRASGKTSKIQSIK